MKSIVLVFLFVATALTTFAQTFTEAAKYNDYIVEQQNLIGENIISFFGEFEDGSKTKADVTVALDGLLNTAKASVLAVQRVTAFEGGDPLKQASIELFQFYVKTIDSDYRELVNLVYDGEIDATAKARLNAIMEKVQTGEATYDENFTKAQVAFAEKNNFTLEENVLQEKLDKN